MGPKHSSFLFSSIVCSQMSNDCIMCDNCKALECDLRNMCIRRAEIRDLRNEIGRSTNYRFILSTSSVANTYLHSEAKRRKRYLTQLRYYKRYNQCLCDQGVNLSMSSASSLFGENSLKDGFDDLDGRGKIEHSDLISFLWKKSVENFTKAKKSGKRNVCFDPVFIKFAIYLRSKMNVGAYDFMANVFNLPPQRTLSNYNTIDGQSTEGILHQTLRQMENELDQRIGGMGTIDPKHEEWLRTGLLKFDEVKVKEKLCFNQYTMELIGFVGGAINDDVI